MYTHRFFFDLFSQIFEELKPRVFQILKKSTQTHTLTPPNYPSRSGMVERRHGFKCLSSLNRDVGHVRLPLPESHESGTWCFMRFRIWEMSLISTLLPAAPLESLSISFLCPCDHEGGRNSPFPPSSHLSIKTDQDLFSNKITKTTDVVSWKRISTIWIMCKLH